MRLLGLAEGVDRGNPSPIVKFATTVGTSNRLWGKEQTGFSATNLRQKIVKNIIVESGYCAFFSDPCSLVSRYARREE